MQRDRAVGSFRAALKQFEFLRLSAAANQLKIPRAVPGCVREEGDVMSLNGEAAVVTGSASGIGRAISLKLAKAGAAVAVWDVNVAGARETVKMILETGGRAIACEGDASSPSGIATAIARTRGELGPITILVNNAAITGMAPFEEMTENTWDRMIRVNLKGPFMCTKAVVPDMLTAGWGRIVNISSSSTLLGVACVTHYVASQGGIIAFTKALAVEYAAAGITVNNICLGHIGAPLLRTTASKLAATVVTAPIKHAGQAEDVAAACSYLVSEAAGYDTGQTISVNAGRRAL